MPDAAAVAAARASLTQLYKLNFVLMASTAELVALSYIYIYIYVYIYIYILDG